MPDSESGQENPLSTTNLSHIFNALDLVRAPLALQEKINRDRESPTFKAFAHGSIHYAIQQGELQPLAGAYLLGELAKDRDGIDAELEKTNGQRSRLAEQTMDPEECFDVCFEDLSQKRREELIQGSLRSRYEAEQEEAVEEDLFHQLIAEGVGVVDANKRYPNSPFLMARLAAAQGEEGYRQLRVVYPPVSGYPDPEEVAKWLAGEGPEPKSP